MNRLIAIAVIAAALAVAPPLAAEEPAVETYTLPNGLTVILKEDRSNPVVAINVWFGIGSAHETDLATGLSHFQEHMVFKGTEKYGVGEIPDAVKSAGGSLNAGTSYSYTMYHVVMPSSSFALGLEVQADAMMNSTFDPDEFLEILRLPFGEAMDWLRSGRICETKTVIGLFWLEKMFQQCW